MVERFVITSRVVKIERKEDPRWVSGVGEGAVFEKVDLGYWVLFEGSWEAIHFGFAPPPWEKGDYVKISFEKTEPPKTEPIVVIDGPPPHLRELFIQAMQDQPLPPIKPVVVRSGVLVVEEPVGSFERPSRLRQELRLEARAKGYEGDPCVHCQNFTLIRNGTCLKCDTCGSTTGCS